jgi:hypothetical protein
MVFQPGVSGNPLGRPAQKPGEKRPMRKRIELVVTPGGGPIDELDLLSAIVNSDADIRTRMGAAVGLARYRKPPAQRWVGKPLDLPPSTSVEQATATIAVLASLSRSNVISLEMANDLIAQEKAFIEAKTETEIETRLKALEEHLELHPPPPPEIEVIGGLPPLARDPNDPWPGVDMPKRAVTPPKGTPGGGER